MNDAVPAEVLRATILAGTVPAPGRPSGLPPAWSTDTPEPGWFERDMAARAPSQPVPSQRAPGQAAGPASLPAAVASPDAPLHGLGVGELGAAYAQGRTDPVAVVRALADRMAAHPSGRDAVLVPIEGAHALAEESAARLREGRARPLEGVPFGVKDIIDVAGARVTAG